MCVCFPPRSRADPPALRCQTSALPSLYCAHPVMHALVCMRGTVFTQALFRLAQLDIGKHSRVSTLSAPNGEHPIYSNDQKCTSDYIKSTLERHDFLSLLSLLLFLAHARVDPSEFMPQVRILTFRSNDRQNFLRVFDRASHAGRLSRRFILPGGRLFPVSTRDVRGGNRSLHAPLLRPLPCRKILPVGNIIRGNLILSQR